MKKHQVMGVNRRKDEPDEAMVHIEEKMGSHETTEFQVVFSVGVQSFEVGPRYDDEKEADWYMNQFSRALDKFVALVTGVELTRRADK